MIQGVKSRIRKLVQANKLIIDLILAAWIFISGLIMLLYRRIGSGSLAFSTRLLIF